MEAEEGVRHSEDEVRVGLDDLAFLDFLKLCDRLLSHHAVLYSPDAALRPVLLRECPISPFSTLPIRCPSAWLDSVLMEDDMLRREGWLAGRLLD